MQYILSNKGKNILQFIIATVFFCVSLNQVLAQDRIVEKDDLTAIEKVTDIVVVFKMHVDIGYTEWAEGVLQNYSGGMLKETLHSLDVTSTLPKSEQFIWTIPSWPLKYMLENCSPEDKIKLEKAIQEERIIPHALPITFETEASDLENLVRGLSFASSINRKYKLPLPRDSKLTDVPSHSRILPTLLKNAGVDILHLGCNPGSTAPAVPPLFWWQGPDGSRLLTFYWAEYYGSGILPPEDWKHKTWLAMIHTHENTGAPSPEEVEDLLKTAKEKIPHARVKIGRLSDFFDLLMKENPDLPVITGDMPDTWIHGYMSAPRETKLSKLLQRKTYDTEMLNTLIGNWMGTSEQINSHIDKAVESMILYDEHTFGIALSHGNQQDWSYNDEFKINKSLDYYSYAEGSWLEKANRIRTAERIITPLMRKQLKKLARSTEIEGKRVIVYNSLPWNRSGRVKFFAGIYQKNFRIYGMKDAITGEEYLVYNDNNLLSFNTKNIPAMGYRTYIPILEPINEDKKLIVLDEANHQLENAFFKLVIDPKTGTLSSVYDKKNKKELVNQESHDRFGEYVYEQFGQNQLDTYNKDYVKPGSEHWANQEMGRPNVPGKENRKLKGLCEKISYLEMGNAIQATIFGKLEDSDSQRYLITYTLYKDQPYIEVNWGIDWKKANSLPEAGWLSFPFNIEKPEYRLYRTGGIVDPNREFVERSNQDFYFLNTAMTMFDDSGGGVALNCPNSPGISIDNPGLYQFSKTKTLSTASVYVNLFNNQWGTNFAEWIEGSFSSKFYIWSYSAYDAEKSLITPSEETRTPLYGVYFDGNSGISPLAQNGITLNRKGILVTAYGQNRDGEGTILRLWEQAGNSGNCLVSLPEGSNYTMAYLCNLRGEIMDPEEIAITDSQFEIFINANQPATVIFK